MSAHERMGKEESLIQQTYELIERITASGVTDYGVRIVVHAVCRAEYRSISSDPAQALELIERMSRADLSPVHFGDVVRDYLTELYFKRLAANGLLE